MGGCLPKGTVSQGDKRFQHAPFESSHRVLHTGSEAEHALELRLLDQKVSVGSQLVGAAEQGRHAVHELGHQARVGVVSLAVVIGHHLREEAEESGSLSHFIPSHAKF